MIDTKTLRDEVALAVALDFLGDEGAVAEFAKKATEDGTGEENGIAVPLMRMAFKYADAFMEARGQ